MRLIQSPDVPEDSTSGALATLAMYGDETCIPHVFELLNSSSSVVTSAVEETLLNIKGRNAARAINAELLKLPSARQAELSATLARRGDLHNPPGCVARPGCPCSRPHS